MILGGALALMIEPDGSMGDPSIDRRSRAIEAASAIARALRIECSLPTILKDANNTIIQLAPAPIVAKVATTTIRQQARERLERELSIAQHLASCHAPIAHPTTSVPPGPHRHGATMLTLWELQDHDPQRSVEPARLAAALKTLDEAFSGYPGELPAFTDQVKETGNVLSDPILTKMLPRDDR